MKGLQKKKFFYSGSTRPTINKAEREKGNSEILLKKNKKVIGKINWKLGIKMCADRLFQYHVGNGASQTQLE